MYKNKIIFEIEVFCSHDTTPKIHTHVSVRVVSECFPKNLTISTQEKNVTTTTTNKHSGFHSVSVLTHVFAEKQTDVQTRDIVAAGPKAYQTHSTLNMGNI